MTMPDATMTFQLLGAVEVSVAGKTVLLGPPQQRTILACLVIDAGQPVPLRTWRSGCGAPSSQPGPARRCTRTLPASATSSSRSRR